jgi:hypothetical protein
MSLKGENGCGSETKQREEAVKLKVKQFESLPLVRINSD